MTAVRAADLPKGSVVAEENCVWIKIARSCWQCTDGGGADNSYINGLLANGARVLRVGTGES